MIGGCKRRLFGLASVAAIGAAFVGGTSPAEAAAPVIALSNAYYGNTW